MYFIKKAQTQRPQMLDLLNINNWISIGKKRKKKKIEDLLMWQVETY
jgi:hypothetical protein